MQITNNQTWLDITCQATGTLDNLFAIALANGVSITDVPIAGAEAVIAGDIHKNKENYLKEKNVVIGTRDDSTATMEGIGYWYLENDFEVQ